MPLPSLIEIEPLAGVPEACVTVPGSKSITNRALVLAALGRGRTTLRGALWSEDTRVMTECLERLGFDVEVESDPVETGNRTISVTGHGGDIPVPRGTRFPMELFVGNAGTAARFLAAMVCLGSGSYRLSGVPRMHERPQAELFRALRGLGYRIEAPNDRLPAEIQGGGRRPGRCAVSVNESSQFASALILGSRAGGWDVEVAGGDEEELPYVEMTREMVGQFPVGGGEFRVEPDASSGSYFWGADSVLGQGTRRTGRIRVEAWPDSGWQADAAFPRYLPLPEEISRATDLADSIMTAIVLAPFAERPVRFTRLGRLRVQECERVAALRTELTRCGARVEEGGDTLTVHPSKLHGAEGETYGDHRRARCFAVVGLKVEGIRLRDPGCVGKTFPNFFARLAEPPPRGLGVRLRSSGAGTGAYLGGDDLLAG
ncbi:MAG: 3-phosphoshikimate 1-carboxyvinyltransferase [Limisphaerales bacterium]